RWWLQRVSYSSRLFSSIILSVNAHVVCHLRSCDRYFCRAVSPTGSVCAHPNRCSNHRLALVSKVSSPFRILIRTSRAVALVIEPSRDKAGCTDMSYAYAKRWTCFCAAEDYGTRVL